MAIRTEVAGIPIESCDTDVATRKRANENLTLRSDELPNPDPVLRKAGIEIDAYEITAADVRVFATTQSRKAPILAMQWDILPKTENDVALTPPEQIAILKDLFKGYNMRNTLNEMMNAPGYGYQPFEINWCVVGDMLLPVEFIGKPARWFRYNLENELVFQTRDRLKTQPLPDNKFIVARNNPTFDNPYGVNYYGKCFWPAIFRTNGNKWYTIYAEKYGMPWLDASLKDGDKEFDYQNWATKLSQMVQDGVIAHSDAEVLTMLQGAVSTGESYERYLNNANTDIALAVLSTTLTTEIKGGSFASATVLNEVREDVVAGDAKIAEAALNELIMLTYEMNSWDNQLALTFVLIPKSDTNLEQSERDQKLVAANPSLKFTEKYYINNYNLKQEEFELVEQAEATTNTTEE